ncbi:ATP-binding cassette domain-containing protein, partial [Streptomyces sp. NPDC017890]|uniref:ABC transporter ATP-binding protein n=1 Tax=Streptomyces sp. NPDC017890 TaxID=3365015 RepID=UPI00378A9DF6
MRGLGKSYGGTAALRHVDLEIAEGTIVGLLGHNGAGKTTLMSLIAGLLRPDAGEIEVLGHSMARTPRRARRELGLASQELAIYPPLTVFQNLQFFAELAGLRGRAARQRIEEVAHPLALNGLMGRRASWLSGGEQRRVHTAMALIHRPRLVLLDEPTAGVDVETRGRILAHVRELAAQGTAVCYSTHYLPEIEELAADVVVLHQGRVLTRGSVDELVRRHGDSAVELVFSGEPPELDLPWPVTRQGDRLLVRVEQPQSVTAQVLAALGDATTRLSTLRVVRPSLDSVFLRLTGGRHDERADPGAPGSDSDGRSDSN